jgi:hypothetical protein
MIRTAHKWDDTKASYCRAKSTVKAFIIGEAPYTKGNLQTTASKGKEQFESERQASKATLNQKAAF